jgi:hypothetical protein
VSRLAPAAVIGLLTAVGSGSLSLPAEPASRLVLEDFAAKDALGLPKGWKAQRDENRAKVAYHVEAEPGVSFLASTRADQRLYKRMAWEPKAWPIVTWRWRLKPGIMGKPPESAAEDVIAAVFLSLDTDLLVIPVATKYVWSFSKAKGTMTEGGLFGAAEIVVRTGVQPVGTWVEERVNAYEDFKRIHGHEPAKEAWGISVLGGPGVEVDFGPIVALQP